MTYLTDFFRRHNRIISYAGAAILFITFVVNDWLRDSLREGVSKTADAESLFLMRSDNLVSAQTLNNIYQNLGLHMELTKAGKSELSEVDKFNFHINFLRNRTANIELVLANESSLFMASEPVEGLTERLQPLEGVLRSINVSTEDIVRTANAETNPQKPDPLVIASQMKRIVDLAGRIDQTEKEIIAIEVMEFSVIHERNAKRERRYHYATWASYFLYPFGLLIGLIAKLSERRQSLESRELDDA